ncbi:hypothetical protein U91I_01218 [alpha proteobacterium U9-1i]|nr:hypothetical protein U91I_01218 [alpha proteobacterium U9-1i]
MAIVIRMVLGVMCSSVGAEVGPARCAAIAALLRFVSGGRFAIVPV